MRIKDKFLDYFSNDKLKNLLSCIGACICKKIDLVITSILSPQILFAFLSIFIAKCYHQDVLDIITNTQAKMLLQKDYLDPLQHQITETWMAASSLTILLNEYDQKKGTTINQDLIVSKAYNYWRNVTKNWEKEWRRKFQHNLKTAKENKNDLQKRFDNLVENFEEKIFIKLNTCYNNYYSKGESCTASVKTLPLQKTINDFQKEIYLFYMYQNETLKN